MAWQLLTELIAGNAATSIVSYPVRLIRWCEIIPENFAPGDRAVRVRVVTVYVL
jgi:hypothetical protein